MTGVQGSPAAAAGVPVDRRALLAVDLGAESCRVSLLRWVARGDGSGDDVLGPVVQLVHRFSNGPVRGQDGSLRWPLEAILSGVEDGIRSAARLAPEGVRSIAVDGWAVDTVRLGEDGTPLEQPFCYRDPRNAAAAESLHRQISAARMREITGIEIQPLNTVYQLHADQLSGRPPARWLNLPEYVLFRLGAEPVAEQTNASHTQLMDLYGGNWSREIFRAARLDITCAPRIVPPGTLLGRLSGALSAVPGLREAELIAPACHDTASAIAGIAQTGDDWAYISCGTWSLVGTVLSHPLNSPGAREDNFTNLGAVGGGICFHKSVNGMWLLKQCMTAWAEAGEPWSLLDLLEAAEAETPPGSTLHVDDPGLLGMGEMPARINAQRARHGLPPLLPHAKAAPAMVSLILHSLAARYAEVLARLSAHTGRAPRRIVMVGGGAQNSMLRRLTGDCTGMEVIAGPAESSTIGNFAVQLAALEDNLPATSPEFAAAVAGWATRLQG